MKTIKGLHPWPGDAASARTIQRHLPPARITPLPSKQRLRYLLGLDCAFPRKLRPFAVAAAVLWDREKKEPVCEFRHKANIKMPYITGLLGFREIPLLLPLLEQIDHEVDAILVDGQGIAHPRRLGSAAHLSLWLAEDVPVIGVGKSRLVGTFEALAEQQGASVPLIHHHEPVGYVLRSKKGCRPLFVSPGGHVDVKGALSIVMGALAGFRLPEPVRLADRLTRS